MNLREWLDQECVEIKQLAGRLGVSRHAIHNWLNKGIKPHRVHRAKIQRLTKGQIKIGDWDEEGTTTDRLLQSSKANGVHRTQRVGNDKKAKPKSSKARR